MAPVTTRGAATRVLVHAMFAIASGACNQVYGLEATILPPPDAPFTCPAIGETPTFSQLEQHLVQDCRDYAVSASRTLVTALCLTPTRSEVWVASTRDAMLAPAPGLPVPTSTTQNPTTYDHVRPAPDGTRVYLRQIAVTLMPMSITTMLLEYRRGDDGVFAYAGVLPFGDTLTHEPSTIALVDGDDLVVVSSDLGWQDHRHTPAGWVAATSTSFDQLGVDRTTSVSLSADGLRALFFGHRITGLTNEVLYTDRARTSDPFGAARVVPGVPPRPNEILMMPDCEEVYLAGLQSVFRAVRIR